jgi:hypothetical protein
LLGEAPARKFEGQPPFSSSSGDFLTKLIGMPVRVMFDCANILDYWPGSAGKGSKFPMGEAQKELRLWKVDGEFLGRRVILAGSRVAKAWGAPAGQILTWNKADAHCDAFAVLPHPSGVNRWWNDPQNRENAKFFLMEELKRGGFITTSTKA